jgi:hypothetical protein
MDHFLENKFLNKEGASKAALQENDDDDKVALISGMSRDEVQFVVYESFVKEKHSLLGYVRGLVLHSAKLQGLDEAAINVIYPPEKIGEFGKDKFVKNDQDVMNFKNRIIIIMEKY